MKLLLFIASLFSLLVAYELDESQLKQYINECNGNNVESCKKVGYHYKELYDTTVINTSGHRNPDILKESIPYHKKACDKRDASACESLALTYSELGDKANKEEYFKKACDLKAPISCNLLGSIYRTQALNTSGSEKKRMEKKSKNVFSKGLRFESHSILQRSEGALVVFRFYKEAL